MSYAGAPYGGAPYAGGEPEVPPVSPSSPDAWAYAYESVGLPFTEGQRDAWAYLFENVGVERAGGGEEFVDFSTSENCLAVTFTVEAGPIPIPYAWAYIYENVGPGESPPDSPEWAYVYENVVT